METIEELRALGHEVKGPVTGHARSLFGRGQIIVQQVVDGQRVLAAGSDPRADGCAFVL